MRGAVASSVAFGAVVACLAMIPQAASAQAGAAAQTDRQTGVEQLSSSTVMRRAQARAAAAATSQVAVGGPNVTAPGAISERTESRAAVQMVVGGQDRCDPARGTADRDSCRDVIENRASQFARPEGTTTPESTLLAAGQRAGITASTVAPTTGSTPTDADQRTTQELATVLNQQQAQQAANANANNQPTLDANQQAIVNAVVSAITKGN